MGRHILDRLSYGGNKGFFTLFPVTWAQFISLQGIQHTEHFCYISPYTQVVNAQPAYYSFRVYDISGTVGYFFIILRKDAQLICKAL